MDGDEPSADTGQPLRHGDNEGTRSHGADADLSDQMQICEKLGHFPDAGEVAVWMAEKTQDNKPDAALVARIEALEAERRQRDKAEIDEIRRENTRIMEAENVPG